GVVAPVAVSEVVVDPAPVTRVPSLGRAAAGVDRDRLLTLRTVRVQPRVVPVVPSSPSSPVVPEALGYAGSLTLTRRDLELQATYGDPANAARYWQPQNSGDCVLMSVAGVIGILTGRAPTEAQIVYQAMNLLSVTNGKFAGKMMYRGMRDSGKWAFYEDARNLLKQYGIDSNVHSYDSRDTANEDAALEKIKTALAADKAVVTAVYSQILYHKATNYSFRAPDPDAGSDHAVVVTGYDPNTDMITINDSAAPWPNSAGEPYGRAWQIPREVFMEAWNRSSYLTLIAERPENPQVPPSSWKTLQPRRDQAALSGRTARDIQHRTR
ncbi:C39 family peptidase, partial [Mycolicibacterium iranicum]